MSKKAPFSKYLRKLSQAVLQGDAREESFYPALAEMLADVAKATGRDRMCTSPPFQSPPMPGTPISAYGTARTASSAMSRPRSRRKSGWTLIEESEQLTRYRATFPNLILTNFLEFRLYRNGERVETVLAARPVVLNRLRTAPPVEKPDELHALLDRFLGFSLPKVFTAESLGRRTGQTHPVSAGCRRSAA